ncbi:DMT family transporter [Mycobacterium szulgai]|uniref:EamA domain-containing protein n=1 Tax=Mycobacterium szulgai TaxID=1787 RepID=A0A1X2F2X3_MYCSZ|nr:DMT family transporter [Mycobacterium szulgai]MCV7075650.1 DMT family transporter [Mycobacterium szulgai]ORX12757.1 hypothetical protein AWC27_22155 [Mycobacterium szulgai]
MSTVTLSARGLRAIALAVLWAALWAGAFVANKIALDYANAAVVVALRCELAGVVILAFTWRQVRRHTAGELCRTTVIGLLNNAGYLGVIAVALPHISAGMAAILSSLTPLAVLSLSALADRRIGLVQATGVLIGLAGIVLSALGRLHSGQLSGFAISLALCAVAFLTAATYLTPRLLPAGNPYFLTGWQAAVGSLPVTLIALVRPSHPAITGTFIAGLAYLVVGAAIVGMTLWLTLIKEVGPQRASVAHFLPPVFGLALGAIVLHETVTALEVLAAIPVALGVFLATRPARDRPVAMVDPERVDDRPARVLVDARL